MGYAIIRISSELFRQAFHFPDGTRVIGLEHPDDIEIMVAHPDLPDGPMGEAPRAEPLFTRTPEGTTLVAWNLIK